VLVLPKARLTYPDCNPLVDPVADTAADRKMICFLRQQTVGGSLAGSCRFRRLLTVDTMDIADQIRSNNNSHRELNQSWTCNIICFQTLKMEGHRDTPTVLAILWYWKRGWNVHSPSHFTLAINPKGHSGKRNSGH